VEGARGAFRQIKLYDYTPDCVYHITNSSKFQQRFPAWAGSEVLADTSFWALHNFAFTVMRDATWSNQYSRFVVLCVIDWLMCSDEHLATFRHLWRHLSCSVFALVTCNWRLTVQHRRIICVFCQSLVQWNITVFLKPGVTSWVYMRVLNSLAVNLPIEHL